MRRTAVKAMAERMPHLDTVIWEDEFSLDEEFFRALSRSKARHLKLDGVYVDEAFSVMPPLTPAVWSLSSLDIRADLIPVEPKDDDDVMDLETWGRLVSHFFTTLFNTCSSTLETLSWNDVIYSHKKPLSFGDTPLSFPRLRDLRLEIAPSRLETQAFASLLSSPLQHLHLHDGISRDQWGVLSKQPPFRDLESFVMESLSLEHSLSKHVADFIKLHPHLQKLHVHELDLKSQTPRDVAKPPIIYWIIPALKDVSFANLGSLSLGLGGNEYGGLSQFPTTSFDGIGKLTSLEQLCLKVGSGGGRHHQWLINHSELRGCLKDLKNLKMLALCRDTYPHGPGGSFDAEQYYATRYMDHPERTDAESRPDVDRELDALFPSPIQGRGLSEREAKAVVWERAHRNRMLAHAETYVVVLPKLEWMLCGQRPIGFRRDGDGSQRAVPLTRERDECITFLAKTFKVQSGPSVRGENLVFEEPSFN